MAWRKCTVIRCPMMIREGLRRLTIDPKHELADGRTCWKCRSGRTAHLWTRRTMCRT